MTETYHDQVALDIQGAARLIGVTAGALRKWKSQGEGPAFYKAGHALRYQRDAVLRWIEQNTVVPDRTKVT
jgi:Helix-turn-helix domain